MDFDDQSRVGDFEQPADEPVQGSSETILNPQGNVITLPAGASLADLEADGRDLVITLDDGNRIIVPDGAVIVPQIIVNGVAVPPLNIAQLLTGNEPEPAAGGQQSSGGNFADDEGELQAAFDIGDLLPFTELAFGEEQEEEIIPGVDNEPEVVIRTIDNPVGVTNATAQVDEDGLPLRGPSPSEPEGTRSETNSETTSGTIVYKATDGLAAILINEEELTDAGQTFTTAVGVLTVTQINFETGEVEFSYSLQDNTTDDRTDPFEVVIVDADGDEATATLNILINDDGPIAADDFGIVPSGTHAPISGDVLANDVPGADDYALEGAVQSFSNASGDAAAGETLQGEYGALTLNGDGTYTYERGINTPGGVEETFDYTILDQDGSVSGATLVIQIEDALDAITSVPRFGDGTVVEEGALAPRDNEPVGSGEIADSDPDNNSDPAETTGATITFSSPDGVDSITLNEVEVDPVNLPQIVIDDDTGTLVVTGYSYDPVTGAGSITYEYTLGDNTSGDDTNVEVDITLTDLDGDVAEDTLVISIVDDEPEALDDGAGQASENEPVTISVLDNDIVGADDVQADTIAVVNGSLTGGGTLVNNGDGTFTYTPAPGEEGDVSFDYTITDGDGDVSQATVTLELLADSTPEISAEGDDVSAEAGLPARGDEPAGSDAASDAEFANGNIVISTGNDTVASLEINGVDVTNGGNVITAKGVLTITAEGGAYSYSYQLTDNTLAEPDSDGFNLIVTDSDGDTAATTIAIAILDDAPSAEDDSGNLAAGEYGPIGGNVLGNDTQGADGAGVTSYIGAGGTGVAGETVQGEYGVLTIAPDGTYSYHRDAGTAGGVTDTFTYTVTDGDGDIASADLVIAIADGETTLDLPVAGEDGTLVDEAGLDGPPAGSSAASDSETTAGFFTFSAEDGPAAILIDGVTVTGVGQIFNGSFGALEITAINDGSISYSYTLGSSTNGDNTSDTFTVRVEDQDDDFSESTLIIDIVDDVPTAFADADSVTEDGPLLAEGNVLTGTGGSDANTTDGVADVQGADVGSVTGVAFGASSGDVNGSVGVSVGGAYGALTIAADGSYVYTLDNGNEFVQGLDDTQSLTEVFSYTITDGDGDTSTTTVTITIFGQDDPVVITGLDGEGSEQTLFEDDLADGSSPDAGALIQTGSFDITSQDGLLTLTVGGAVVFDANAATAYPVIINDPVYGLLTITGIATTTDSDGDVVAATVSYSYTLQDNSLLHTGGNNGSFTDNFDVVATDTDGSIDTDSLDITIVDDVPTAMADSAAQTVENAAFEIDALANDEFGADDVDTGDAAKVFVSADAGQGSVTYDASTGKFTYTPDPDAGSGGNVSDFFEYTIVDRDGDTSTARVDITLQPDSEPEGGTVTALLDDDGLSGGNAASNTGDLDANNGDAPGNTSEASFEGTLAFMVGNDTPATIAFGAGVDGSSDTIGQETVIYSVAGHVLTATVTGGDRNGLDLFTLEITDTATGDYVVTLLDNVIHLSGDNENDASAAISFVVTDNDLDTVSTNLNIVFDDDAPTASNDDGFVSEGGNTSGNVLTNDVAGADGFGTDGSVIAIASVGEGTNQTTVNASGDLVLSTALGTLTIDSETGAYSYASDIDSTNADTNDQFTYTIVDGDGDEVTATLNIAITNVGGEVSDDGADVNEAGLPSGSDPLSDSEIDADGQITVTGATGTLVFNLLSPANGTYGDLVLDTATGKYTYTLDTPFTDAVDENGTNVVNGAESFDYEVRDTIGNLIDSGTIQVNITDDVPVATDQSNINVAEDAAGTIGGNVTTDGIPDTPGADGATVTEISVGGVIQSVPQDGSDAVLATANGTYTIDMDGNWTFDPAANLDQSGGDIDATFTYTLTDGDGDFDTADQPITITDGEGPNAGPNISLVLDDQNLADGSFPSGDDFDSDTIVFTAGSDDIASIVFGDVSALGGGLTWTRVSDTEITGEDGGRPVVTLELSVAGTVATVTATLDDNYDDHPGINVDDLVDLGDVNVVATDTDGDEAASTVSVSVSDDLPSISASDPVADTLIVDETDLTFDDIADFSGLFTSSFNADNPGTPVSYTLGLNGGATGLVDTATNEAVVLVQNGANIEGRTSGTNALVFTVSVDSAGLVTLDQVRAVKHADSNDPNDDTNLAAADLITLTATIIDSDGDTASATANIAGAMTFRDDGPALSDVEIGSSVSVDETPGLTQSATSLASIISFVADYGADGSNGAAFALNITDANSGLATAVGDYPITLQAASASTIIGVFNDGTGDKTAFTVTINADGTITLTQIVALEHQIDGDDSAGEHNDTLDLTGNISATVTITDGDGDQADATIPIGGALTFFDDGPSVVLSGINDNLTVSDADFAADDSENFANNFTFDGGEDGQASTSFELSVTDGTASGLIDTATGNSVFLFLESGVVVGREGTDAIAAASGDEVFTVAVDNSGNVELDQSRSIDHALSTGSDGSSVALASDGLIQLIGTVTDNDGDTASQALDIGSNLSFTDDVPAAGANDTVLIDDDALGGNAGGTGDDPDAAFTSGTLNHDFGNDGGSIAFGVTGAPAGFIYTPSGDDILIQQDQGNGFVTVVTVTLDPASGDYTVTQNANILHADANDENNETFTLDYTVTDGDTDTALGTLIINADDDTPIASDDGEIASVDDNASSENIGNIADLTGNDSYGADGEGSPAITIAVGSLGGSVSIDLNGDLLYTSATNITAPYADQVESFTYTIEDADGDTATATFEVRLTDEGPAINADAATFTVDEEGLGGIAGNGDDDGDVAGEVTQQSGVLSGIDFGIDGAGTITLTAVADTGLITLAGNAVETVWDAGSRTLTGQDAVTGDDVFTVVITDVLTGAYTFTLLAPVSHPVADTEDDQPLNIGVVVADAEGETANGTISVTIDDDSPLATDDTNALSEDAVSVGGNVVTDLVADNFGADGAGDPEVTAVTGFGGAAGTINGSTAGEFGSLTLNDDGGYTYNLTAALVQGLDEGESETDIFTYTIVDADGDTADATLTITINGANDAPVAIADTNWTIEDAGAPITGNVLQDVDHSGAPDAAPRADVEDTDVDIEPLIVTTTGTFSGTYGALTLNADGTYSYDLYTAVQDQAAYDAVQALDEGDTPLQDVFNYTASDGDLTSNSTLTIDIFGANDAPVVGTATVATSDEGLPGGLADMVGTSDTTNLASASGSITISDVDDAVFTVTLATPPQTIAVADGTSTGAAIAWSLSPDGKTLTGTINGGADTAVTVVIDDLGDFTVTQSLPIFHPDDTAEDVTFFTIDVSANDGTATTTQSDAITVNLEDDSPVAVVADDMVITNAGGSSATADLDLDDDVDNNFGADGGRVVFTQASVDALVAQNLTSSLTALEYLISADGTVLTANKEGGGDLVFTLTLDPDTSPDQYVLDLTLEIDAVSTIDFNDAGYDFVGGNGSWAGFNLPGTIGSQDLLLTPIESGVNAGSVNTNANEGGVSDGNSVKTGEAMRADFIIDLTGTPPSNIDYEDVGGDNHTFSGHYTVNGASALFTSITGGTAESTLKLTAFDDNDGDNVVGDGIIDTITQVTIGFNGANHLVEVSGTYLVGGQSYTVTFNGNGTVDISGIVSNTDVAAFTADGYTSIEFENIGGSPFKIGDFGASSITDDPVPFSVPISVIDNDGDIVSSGDLDITANPDAPQLLSMNSIVPSSTNEVMSIDLQLGDPIIGSNDNGTDGGLIGGGTRLASLSGVNRAGLRIGEANLVAAISAAMLTDYTWFHEGLGLGAYQSDFVQYELPDPVRAPALEPVTQSGDGYHMEMPTLEIISDSFAFSNDWGSLQGESALASSPEISLGTQAEPNEIEFYQSGDWGSNGLDQSIFSSANEGGHVDQAMEALLTLQPGSDAIASSIEDPELVEGLGDDVSGIFADIANEAAIDLMIEQLSEIPGGSDHLTTEYGVLDMVVLNQVVESSFGAVNSMELIDAHSDQAAASAVVA